MDIDPQQPSAMILQAAIDKTKMALRSLTEHQPPILNLAAHGLLMALEHVNTLAAIESEANAKARGKPPARGAARKGAG